MSRKKRRQLPDPPESVQISKLSHEGRGVAAVAGKTTFIRGALAGEKVSFRYTRSHSKFDEGHVEQVFEPAAERVEPKCAVYGICGGCSLQHLSADGQISHKQQVLAEQLQHLGAVTVNNWLPPLTAGTWGYRRKARLGVRYVFKKDSVLVGFREADGRFLTDMSRCEVLHPSVGEKIAELRALLTGLDARDQIPQLEVAVDAQITAVIVRHMQSLSEHDMQALTDFAKEHNWWLYLQPKGPDTIELYYPKTNGLLHYLLPEYDLRLYFYPQDFTQINHELNQKMIARALALLDLQADDKVLDLFCGLGNFSLPMARTACQVVGIEGDDAMTSRALYNARANDIANASFHSSDLFADSCHQLIAGINFNKVLLDPPRAGAYNLMPILGRSAVERIVYVSCNPATMARDVGVLVNDYGFELDQAGIMDMFPHTAHVESVVLLTKTGSKDYGSSN